MAATPRRKRPGRPKKAPTQGKRNSLGLRVDAELKAELDNAAEASGRSQSQEAEIRLRESFRRERTADDIRKSVMRGIYEEFGGEQYFRLMRLIADVMRTVEGITGKAWQQDRKTSDLVRSTIDAFIETVGPQTREEPTSFWEGPDTGHLLIDKILEGKAPKAAAKYRARNEKLLEKFDRGMEPKN
jgi:hypothetical protein